MNSNSLSHRHAAALAGICLLLGGCATNYEMKVDAISQPATKEITSYKIKNKHPVTDSDDLRAQEAAGFVKTALSGRGLYEAPNPENADMIVEVDYGVEPPRVRMEHSSVPVYAQVGGGVRYEQVPTIDGKGNPMSRTVAVYDPPRTEMIGFQEVITPVQVYEKYLRISAHENKPAVEGQPPAEIWSVNVSSEDESKDLRKYLPLLASTSADYIGRDTTAEKTVKIKPSDAGPVFVKKGM